MLHFYKIRQPVFLIRFILQRLGTDVGSITHIDSVKDAKVNILLGTSYSAPEAKNYGSE
jgi:hypothetical protein